MVRTFISLSSLHLKEGDFSLFMQNIKNLMRNCVPVLCLNYCSAFAKSTRRLHWPWTIMARRLLRLACRSPHTVGEQKEVWGADFVVPREGANNKCFVCKHGYGLRWAWNPSSCATRGSSTTSQWIEVNMCRGWRHTRRWNSFGIILLTQGW